MAGVHPINLIDISSQLTRAIAIFSVSLAVIMAQGPVSLLAGQAPQKGCHDHGSGMPDPKPAGYSCCLTGHDSAIPRTYASSHVTAQIVPQTLPILSSVVGRYDNCGKPATPLSGSPPVALPLRI